MNKLFSKTVRLALTITSVLFASSAWAATASFDSLSEGSLGESFTDGGITFSDLNAVSDNFSIDTVPSSSIPEFGEFLSDPNFLTFGGFGAGTGFSSFGSMEMTTGELANFASLDIFTLANSPETSTLGNTLSIEAFLAGNLVGSVASPGSNFEPAVTGSQFFHQELSISGVSFDALRLVSSGSFNAGLSLIGVDNVTITSRAVPETTPATGSTAIPEPTSTWSLIAFSIIGTTLAWKRFLYFRF